MSKVATPTLDRYHELAKQPGGALLQSMFLKSAANRVLMDREQSAIDDAQTAKADKTAAKLLATQPHHKRLEELRAQHPMLANTYELNHRHELALEVKEVEAATPATTRLNVTEFVAPPNVNPPPDDPPPMAA